jgi:redox-sensing transcriptional repressor
MVGIGNLGRALMGYRGFSEQGFRVVAAFDVDPQKTGRLIDKTPVYSIDELESVCRREEIKLAVLAVPADAAQEVADRLVSAGMEGILNFAPVTLNVPPRVGIVAVDLAIQLEQLTFAVVQASLRPNDSDFTDDLPK